MRLISKNLLYDDDDEQDNDDDDEHGDNDDNASVFTSARKYNMDILIEKCYLTIIWHYFV